MTADDDAFIRTIVDNPGNDVPRLVYADWLDDRDDPRGPFLRAEVEWAQPWKDGQPPPGDTTELRVMVSGLTLQEFERREPFGFAYWPRPSGSLEPIWVARIARPPVGVCCDHLRFVGAGPVLHKKEVDEIDRWPEVKLPAEYKAFLLNYNGGLPVRATSLPPRLAEEVILDCEYFRFIPLVPPGDQKARGTLHGEVERYWSRTLPELLSQPLSEDERDVGNSNDWYSEV